MKTNKIYLIGIITLIMLIGMINAEVETLGTFKQGTCINLKQTCGNCTYVNITSVNTEAGSLQIIGQKTMTKIGTEYNYSFCTTNVIGKYIVNQKANPDGEIVVISYDFTITSTGESKTTDSSQYQIMLTLLYAFAMCIIYVIVYKKNRFLGNMGYLMTSIGIMFSFPNTPIGLIIMGCSFLSMIYDLVRKVD